MCITETWLTSTTPDAALALRGYSLFRTDRYSHRGGGCIIYTRNNIEVQLALDPELESAPDSVWLTSTQRSPTVLIGCLYNPPPSSSSSINLISHILTYASSLPYDLKIIVGDFNWPDLHWESLHLCRAPQRFAPIMAQLGVEGWSQLVSNPTRGPQVLDLIFVNGPCQAQASVGPVFPDSDHKVVLANFAFDVSMGRPPPSLLCNIYYPLSPVIMTHIRDSIRLVDWSELFLSPDASTASAFLYTILGDIINSLCPPKTWSDSAKRHRQMMSKQMQRLQRRLIEHADISSALKLEKLASTHTLRRIREECTQEKTALSNHTTSNIFKLFRRRCSTLPAHILSLHHGGTVINEPSHISETMNDYFTSCYSNTCHLSKKTLPLNALNKSHSATLDTITISPASVALTLNRIKDSSTPGPDGLPPSLFKQGGADLTFILSHLFNLSLRSGTYPPQWKDSVITPHYKSGPRTLCTSYRGIHHTPIVSRVFERCLKNPLLSHFISVNKISDRQFGFINRRSVNGCQLKFFSKITKAVDAGECICILYLDITKAFDQVPHDRLLHTLWEAGIRDPLLSCLSSYLRGRKQRTRVNGLLSGYRDIPSGVIQGSVLGPVFFLLYINDVLDHIANGDVFLFADDIKILYSFPPNEVTSSLLRIQADLDSLSLWSHRSGLKFSSSKSCVMAHRFNLPNGHLTLNSEPLSSTLQVRDLGLRYSCSFNFSEQILYQVAKARRLTYLINRAFHLRETKILLFKQVVLPILEFGCAFSSLLTRSETRQIENIQRAFTRCLCMNDFTLNYRERCLLLRLEPLWFRRVKLNLRLLHQLIFNYAHFPDKDICFRPHLSYSLRHNSYTLSCPKVRTTFAHNFFLSLYPRIWNKLPPTLRSIENTRHFSLQLDKYLTPSIVAKFLFDPSPLDSLYELGPGRV